MLEQRCYMCHNAQVQMKNVRLDSPEAVKLHAQNIYQQVVVTKQMPMNNATASPRPSARWLAQWFRQGPYAASAGRPAPRPLGCAWGTILKYFACSQ